MPTPSPPAGGPQPPPPLPAPIPAPLAGAHGVRHLPGLVYALPPGTRPLELDVHLPPVGSAPAPLVLFLHGGGWRVGSRHTAGPAYRATDPTPFEQLALRGIAVASADYRLSGEAVWPAQLDDVSAALAWLAEHADELGVDAGRVGLWGESSGGHLAALLGLRRASTPSGVAVRGVVTWYPPTDLAALPADLGQDPTADTRESQLLGAPAASVPDLARDASPVHHLTPGAPPFLILHGEADEAIPARQSVRFHGALTRAGVPSRLVLLPDAGHLWSGSPAAAERALAATVDHLADLLAGGDASPRHPFTHHPQESS